MSSFNRMEVDLRTTRKLGLQREPTANCKSRFVLEVNSHGIGKGCFGDTVSFGRWFCGRVAHNGDGNCRDSK